MKVTAFSFLFTACLGVSHTHGVILQRQSGPVDPGISPNCDYFDTAYSTSDNCEYFESYWGISHENFIKWVSSQITFSGYEPF